MNLTHSHTSTYYIALLTHQHLHMHADYFIWISFNHIIQLKH